MTTLERRHSERARIPCTIPVELTDASRRSQFEAETVDLSVGGLSLRSSHLPELGSQLFCCFEAEPSGAQVLGRGEVVWRQPTDGDAGEFGLRFIEVDARNQALIDEMVAERIARIQGPKAPEPEPELATLEIEDVAGEVSARVLHAGDREALFEQTLDQFSVGKSVTAHVGMSLLQGHIAAVRLRMEGTTPRIVLSLQLPAPEPESFGEYEWGDSSSDTDPDIFGTGTTAKRPPILQQMHAYIAEPHEAALVGEDAAGPDAGYEYDDDGYQEGSEDQPEYGVAYAESVDELSGEHETVQVEHAEGAVPADQAVHEEALPAYRREQPRMASAGGARGAAMLAPDPRELVQQRMRRETVRWAASAHANDHHATDQAVAATFPGGAPQAPGDMDDMDVEVHVHDPMPGAELGPELDAQDPSDAELEAANEAAFYDPAQPGEAGRQDDTDVDLPVYEEPSNTFIVRMLRVLARLVDAYHALVERTHARFTGLRASVGSRQGLGRALGRKVVASRPRRVTSATQRIPLTSEPNTLRSIAVFVLGVATAGLLGWFALTSGSRSDYPTHPIADAEQGADGRSAPLLDDAAPSAAPAATAPAAPSAQVTTNTARRDAAGSSNALAVGGGNPGAEPRNVTTVTRSFVSTSTQFGQKQLRNPRRFMLRMAEPVRQLQGAAEPGGFAVIISDNRALDRAAPIRAALPAVARAAIVNHAKEHTVELNVRFVPGQNPGYRVTASDAAIEVLIEQ